MVAISQAFGGDGSSSPFELRLEALSLVGRLPYLPNSIVLPPGGQFGRYSSSKLLSLCPSDRLPHSMVGEVTESLYVTGATL